MPIADELLGFRASFVMLILGAAGAWCIHGTLAFLAITSAWKSMWQNVGCKVAAVSVLSSWYRTACIVCTIVSLMKTMCIALSVHES